jgi:predicted nucleic acid-binding protein
VVGTIGVLLRAKRGGVFTTLRPLLEALELNGFYLSVDLKREALRLAGE